MSEEKSLRTLIRSTLTFAGYRCLEAESVEAARRLRRSKTFDVVVLDLDDATHRGPALRERVVSVRPFPIVALYDELSHQQRQELGDVGPHDFIAKPFRKKDLSELLHKVLHRAEVTRFGAPQHTGNELVCGPLKMEIAERRVTQRGRPLHLTPLEFNLLRVLMINRGRVVTQRFLLDAVWGPQAGRDLTYVRVFIAALRGKIEEEPSAPKYLHTKRKAGYLLVAPDEAGAPSGN